MQNAVAGFELQKIDELGKIRGEKQIPSKANTAFKALSRGIEHFK